MRCWLLSFQYSAYEAGAGETCWVKDRNGIQVPVINARYSIWEHANNARTRRHTCQGRREIRQTVENTGPEQVPRYDWVIDHVWSYFKRAWNRRGCEIMPQENAAAEDGVAAIPQSRRCAEHLPAGIRVISPELVWHPHGNDPSQTKKLIGQFQ